MIRSRLTTLLGMQFLLTIFVCSGLAQDSAKVINGGVLNGKAISLPKPEYPEAAKSAGIAGAIAVNVVIDESGNVVSAEAHLSDPVERHDANGAKLEPLPADPMLRDAAERAAWQAKFAPTRLNSVPVRIRGMIIYNFVAGSDAGGSAELQTPMTKTVSGGVLNGRATTMPSPSYPAAAKAVRAEGSVSIQEMIDEDGNVISAAAVSGHPLLRAAAELAARSAGFEPTLLNGKPVKVSGVLTYNFVMPKVEQ